MSRLPNIDPSKLSANQKEAFDKITNGPRGGVRGPFIPMLLSPEVCNYAQGLGAYLRFDGVLPGKLRELAILTTARFWESDYEWNAHVPFAKKEGLDPAVIDAIAEEKTPDFTDEDEKAVHAFVSSLYRNHHIDDVTFNTVRDALGEEAALELTVVAGYYTLISMVLTAFEVPLPEGARPLT